MNTPRNTNGADNSGPLTTPPDPSATTGRYLVLFREGGLERGLQTLSERAGLSMVRAADFDANALSAEALESGNVVLDTIGVAIVNLPPEQLSSMGVMVASDSEIIAIEEEHYLSILDAAPVDTALTTYLRGYQAGVAQLVNGLLPTGTSTITDSVKDTSVDESVLTWGLQATKVDASQYTGKGIRVAVLDTGFDFGHPDFVGRSITSQSFVSGLTADDGHGHGTHCIGTSCGPKRPGQLPRYGIASEAEIYVGKVLDNSGSGTDGSILAGIEWAIKNQCAVVSMSLGAPVQVGTPFSPIYEEVAKRALAAGTLIVVAAGNDSNRPADIKPVSRPANCPSILAVGALDVDLNIAFFSNGGINPNGGQVDIVGPGYKVRSSWLRPTLYNTISGTSMATPHVAGIAALFAEANPAMRGGSLGWLLLQNAQRLMAPARDAGAGLVQAP